MSVPLEIFEVQSELGSYNKNGSNHVVRNEVLSCVSMWLKCSKNKVQQNCLTFNIEGGFRRKS